MTVFETELGLELGNKKESRLIFNSFAIRTTVSNFGLLFPFSNWMIVRTHICNFSANCCCVILSFFRLFDTSFPNISKAFCNTTHLKYILLWFQNHINILVDYVRWVINHITKGKFDAKEKAIRVFLSLNKKVRYYLYSMSCAFDSESQLILYNLCFIFINIKSQYLFVINIKIISTLMIFNINKCAFLFFVCRCRAPPFVGFKTEIYKRRI